MRWVSWILLVPLGLLLMVAFGGSAFLLNTYEPPPVDPAWAVPPATRVPKGAVTVRFTGTTTLTFSDGETTWMTDGWFSRPGPLELLAGEIEPDLDAITKGLENNDVHELAAVFVLHSHYDHAMDAPEVAKRTGAVLLGSESTANIGRGWGLDEAQIRVVVDREPIPIGNFILTPIELRHFEFPDPALRARLLDHPSIDAPLTPPVPFFDYRVGKVYALHVAHPKGSWLILGSAGFVEGALEGYEADVVFLGIGGLGSQTDAYRETYWRESVGYAKPSRLILIHWDSLTGPIEGPFTGMVRAAALFSRGSEQLLPFLRAKEAEHPEIELITLPRYDAVVLF